MSHRKNFIALAAALAILVSFNCLAADLYKVSASLAYKDKPFGTPSAIVKSDTPASVEMTGPSGYKLSFTVTDLAPDQIKVATSLDSTHGALAPTVVVRPGQPATVSVGDLSLTLKVDRAGS